MFVKDLSQILITILEDQEDITKTVATGAGGSKTIDLLVVVSIVFFGFPSFVVKGSLLLALFDVVVVGCSSIVYAVGIAVSVHGDVQQRDDVGMGTTDT